MSSDRLSFDVQNEVEQIAQGFRVLLTEQEVKQALGRALNRAITGARTEAVRSIRTAYKTRATDIRKTMTLVRANANRLETRLDLRGKQLPVFGFGARQNAKGVSVNITGQRKKITSAFIANVKQFGQADGGAATTRSVFIRVEARGRNGDQRLQKIKRITTLAIPQALKNDAVDKAVTKRVDEQLPTLFERELNFAILNKTGAARVFRR